MRAGIYARISHDPLETNLGVDRQIEDCTREAEKRGWEIVELYTDNDVSATRSKVRPEYERMISDVRNGYINALIVWDIDRLTRTPRELEDVIDLADKMNLNMANVGGEIDLSTPQGKMTARIKGSVARHEADQMSRRLRRAFQQRALSGIQHSGVGYGFIREDRDEGKWDVAHPEQAPVIVEAAERFVSGESMRSIGIDFDRRGIKAPRVDKWNTTSLKQVLIRPVNIGKRKHKGEIVGEARADAIMSEDLYNQVLARLSDPERAAHVQTQPYAHLLSGIAKCGFCGGKTRYSRARINAGKSTPAQYSCKECFKTRRKADPMDELVTLAVLARLEDPALLRALSVDNSGKLEASRTKYDGLQARLEVAADQFADGAITGEQLKRINTRLLPQVEDLKRRIAHMQGTNPILSMAGPNATERWNAAPIEIQRGIVEMLMEITVLPAGTGKKFDPELIKIEWKA